MTVLERGRHDSPGIHGAWRLMTSVLSPEPRAPSLAGLPGQTGKAPRAEDPFPRSHRRRAIGPAFDPWAGDRNQTVRAVATSSHNVPSSAWSVTGVCDTKLCVSKSGPSRSPRGDTLPQAALSDVLQPNGIKVPSWQGRVPRPLPPPPSPGPSPSLTPASTQAPSHYREGSGCRGGRG